MSLTVTDTKLNEPRRSTSSIGILPVSARSSAGNLASSSNDLPPGHPTLRPTHGTFTTQDDVEMDVFPSSTKASMEPSVNIPNADPCHMSAWDERLYLAALCYCIFAIGWNDATLGPLLPRIQESYDINYTVVSFLFISGFLGSVSGSFSNVYLSDKLGFGKLIAMAAALQLATYATMAPGPPFAVMCVAWFFNSIAGSLMDAQCNTFIASIPRNDSKNMGILHSVYGLGAFTSPFVATRFSQMPRWSFHFLASLGLAFVNVAILLNVFRFKRQSSFIYEPPASTMETASQVAAAQGNKYKQIFRQKSVHAMSLFILFYVGVEVTIGGWIVTFILRQRGGGPSSGYVSSGFFGGLTLGRLVLIPVNVKVGNERVIYIYSVLAMVLEFTVWFVPSLIENAIAVAFVGFFLGPFYPISMTVIAGLLPRSILSGSIGWIAAFGQAGAAVFPFMTGAMATRYGVQVLQPLLVALIAAQTVLWFFVTHSKTSRRD